MFSSLFLLHVLHLLLLALVVVIAVHLLVLPILRPFLLITNWPTYSHRRFQNTTESEQPLSQGIKTLKNLTTAYISMKNE